MTFFFKEQVETPHESATITPITQQPDGSAVATSGGKDVNGEEEVAEEEVTVEMPPPMEEIHTPHPLPSQPTSQEDVHSKLVG